jgi:hypothetical protein
MSGYKILLLLGAIAFLIGALLPAFIGPEGSPRNIGWTNLGLAFVTFAVFVNAH